MRKSGTVIILDKSFMKQPHTLLQVNVISLLSKINSENKNWRVALLSAYFCFANQNPTMINLTLFSLLLQVIPTDLFRKSVYKFNSDN